MVAAEKPVLFLLHLPLGDCSECVSAPVLDLESGHHVSGASTIVLHVSRRPAPRGWSLVPFASMLDLGARFPRIRELHLCSVVVHTKASHGAPLQQPRFACLESLIISNWSVKLPIEGAFSWSMLDLLQHMPRLKTLNVFAPTMHPFVEPAGQPLHWAELPFSLTQFICAAAIPVSACADIISCSRHTLEELTLNLSGKDDVSLITALAHAAPRLRELSLGLRMPTDSAAWPQVKAVFSALARVEVLSLETPMGLQHTLDLLAGLDSLRSLSLWYRLDVGEESVAASRLTAHVLQLRCLRSITVCGFNIGDEERKGVLELCRSRRIDGYIAN